MKVLITGSRTWTDWEAIRTELKALPKDVIIIHGACPSGADYIADKIVKEELGIEPKPYPANWTKYGRGAGKVRNQEMLDKEHPDLVLAFHKANSPGTADMIERALNAHISVKTILGEETL